MKITVRKQPPARGLARITQDRSIRDVAVDGKKVATVAPTKDRWYWYGFGNNTIWSGLTFETRDAAIDHCKSQIRLADAVERGGKE